MSDSKNTIRRVFTAVISDDGISTLTGFAGGYSAGSAPSLVDAALQLVPCGDWTELLEVLVERMVYDEASAAALRASVERAIARRAEKGFETEFDLWCVDTGEKDSASRYLLAGPDRQGANELLCDLRTSWRDPDKGSIRRCRRLLFSDLGTDAAKFASQVAEGIRESAGSFIVPGGSVPEETWAQWDDELVLVDDEAIRHALSACIKLEAFVCEGDEVEA